MKKVDERKEKEMDMYWFLFFYICAIGFTQLDRLSPRRSFPLGLVLGFVFAVVITLLGVVTYYEQIAPMTQFLGAILLGAILLGAYIGCVLVVSFLLNLVRKEDD